MKFLSSEPVTLKGCAKTYIIKMISGDKHTITINPMLKYCYFTAYRTNTKNPYYLTDPSDEIKTRIANGWVRDNINYALVEEYKETSSETREIIVYKKIYKYLLFFTDITWEKNSETV